MSDNSKPKYKQILVPVPMAEHYEVNTIRRQTGTKTVQKHKGIMNPKKVTVEEPIYEYIEEALPTGKSSDTEPDSKKTAKDVESACNALAKDGYKVISVTPILRGVYGHHTKPGIIKKGTGATGYAYGFGYSVTDSLIVLGELVGSE